MLQVKAHLDHSKVCEGMGVFLDENIVKNTIVSEDNSFFTVVFSGKEIDDLPPYIKKRINEMNHFWIDSIGDWRFSLDDDRFICHSSFPNVKPSDHNQTRWVASMDIDSGTELTCDYRLLMPHRDQLP